MVLPILIYGCEIWGFENYNKLDSVQNKASRVFLGLHKFAPLLVLEGDMGWIKTRYRRWTNMLRMWNRLVTLDDDRLTK